MSRGLMIGIAIIVLLAGAAAGFALARGRYVASGAPVPAASQGSTAREGHPYGGVRRALEGVVVAWEGGRLILQSQKVTYTVSISPRTRVIRRTGEVVGARALVLGRLQDSAMNAVMVILLPAGSRQSP